MAMTFADLLVGYRSSCETALLRLRRLAAGEADAIPPSRAATEVREATNAVIAEADAAGRAAHAASSDAAGEVAGETFLWVRLARLAQAADEAVNAARVSDGNGLRRHLHRFDVLARAMWAVQDAVYGQVALSRPPDEPQVAGVVARTLHR
jgi:hypothetical protein